MIGLLPERWESLASRVRLGLAKRAARHPLRVVLAAGAVALGVGLPAWHYTESIYWGLPWLALLGGLGRLGFTTVPVFKEKNPVPVRRRRVRDGRLMMMELPGGEFMMGSPDSDELAGGDEKPRHPVTVSSFRIAATPVTVALYREIMGGDPPSNAEAREPVVNMNWDDAVRFCNALSEREGYRPCYHRNVFRRWRCDWRVDGYRLPTEAEWEFACRAGTKTRYGFGNDPDELDAYGWYTENANGPQPVAAKRPNRWGLYDMHGNVWEWCWDRYGSYSPRPRKNPRRPTRLYVRSLFGRRVVRGGSFVAPPESLRSANRVGNLLPTRNCLGVQTAPRSICSKNPSGSSLAQPGG